MNDHDAFRSTYKTYGSSKTSVSDAKSDRDKAQVVYDSAMSDASVSERSTWATPVT